MTDSSAGAATLRLSERAATHVREFMQRESSAVGLRVGVKPSGCSGYRYEVELARTCEPGMHVFHSQGVDVYVDADSLPMLAGCELDYVRDGLQTGFRFRNPNVSGTCGCGESFAVGDLGAAGEHGA